MSTRSGRSSRAFHRLRRGENSRPGYARGLCSATDVAGLRQRGDTREKVAWLGLFLSSVAPPVAGVFGVDEQRRDAGTSGLLREECPPEMTSYERVGDGWP
jgi:hypothetical protein